MDNRFEPRKRTALDGKIWWCIFDKDKHTWSTFLCHKKYKTKKEANIAIENGKINI